jgi:hypothetical protein
VRCRPAYTKRPLRIQAWALAVGRSLRGFGLFQIQCDSRCVLNAVVDQLACQLQAGLAMELQEEPSANIADQLAQLANRYIGRQAAAACERARARACPHRLVCTA